MKQRIEVQAITEQAVQRTAHILGPQSAAALALADAERRRREGQQVAFYRRGNAILVGPPATPAADAGRRRSGTAATPGKS